MLVPTLVANPSAQAQTLTVLYSFTGGADGYWPYAALIRDVAGNLYGTTFWGGAFDVGTVFKVDSTGEETVLHSFTGGADGENPYAGLTGDAAGNLYGTTIGGGGNQPCNYYYGCGTVFELDATGKETVLHSFTDSPDGANPFAGLIRDAAGNLYGTTAGGGAFGFYGTVFKLTTGKYEVLYSFTGGADGAGPAGGLIRDAAGNLYGTSGAGGASNQGTVFELDVTGKETVLYKFGHGNRDGAGPVGGLVSDATGNLYGATVLGGTSGIGTVFKVDSRGKGTVLHSFTGQPDGAFPRAGLVRDAKGNLYGTTSSGGAFDAGTLFKVALNTTGKYEVLHSFTGADGANPYAALIRDAAGNLYGTTFGGGAFGLGTVFKLTP
jgi:uncharacterized repeat protein (TIGR03803 family)